VHIFSRCFVQFGVVPKAALALAIMLVPAVLATGSAQAQTFTTLHSFDGTDGSEPGYTAPVQATDGNFYGTTEAGGANSYGTVYKITPSGTLTTLDAVSGQPWAPLVQGTDGNFYGTTICGGTNPSECGRRWSVPRTAHRRMGKRFRFMKGKTVLGTGTLSGGTATYTTTTLKVGTNSITAVYGGDANFAASKSKPVKQVVEKAQE
jgi:uncharacterized repeat protein (TIGR03803 family)